VDVLTVIVDRMKESMLRHRLRWVKAHQDEKKSYEDLDKWGRMNCDADKMAEKFRKLMDDSSRSTNDDFCGTLSLHRVVKAF
jgi:hypothetical protein